jgi:hypothetical protein
MKDAQFWLLERQEGFASIEVSTSAIPGVRCPVCEKTWVVVSRIPMALPHTASCPKFKSGPQSPSVLKHAYRKAISLFGESVSGYLAPGAMLGPATLIGSFKPKWLEEVQWFGGHRLFVGSERAAMLSREVGAELVFQPVEPRMCELTEILPHLLKRADIFPEVVCRECGLRETRRPDWNRIDSLIAEVLPRVHLMNTPRGMLCTDRFRTALVAVPGVRFETFELIVK